MKTRRIVVKATGKSKDLYAHFARQCHLAKNLQNTANFYIRNLRSGLKKDPADRTQRENEVIQVTMEAIDRYNKHKQEQFANAVQRARKLAVKGQVLNAHALVRKYLLNLDTYMRYPDEQHWILSYEQLNAVMQWSRNRDYYALPGQVNQQILRKVINSWKGYFVALRDYRKSPEKYLGEPKAPKYKRTSYSTLHYTNQIIRRSVSGGRQILRFPGTDLELCIGGEQDCPGIVKVEVKPCGGHLAVLVTYTADTKEPQVPVDPERILGLDAGVRNFLAGTANFPCEPFLIDGQWIKSENRYFNKQRAKLLSILTKGLDSTRSVKNSKRLSALSRKREYKFRDFFYKTAHWIVRYCARNNIEVIVWGHNECQKQKANMGAANNQNFVSIPYMTFYQILKQVAAGAGIPVVQQEESYTSKASLMDQDPLPVYEEGDTTEYIFSGKRVKRGLYQSRDGVLLNADLNGAGNIIRKTYPDAFREVTDWTYLMNDIQVINRRQLCHADSHTARTAQPKPKKLRSDNRIRKHQTHWERKQMYLELFYMEKKQSSEHTGSPAA